MSADLAPWEQRLYSACAEMLNALEDDERHELLALRDLDPDGFRGMTIRHIDDEFIEVSFIGRRLGAIRREWLFAGDVA